MAHHVNNSILLLENTFRIKEEECNEDNFIDDKVDTDEIAAAAEDIWCDRIKQHELSTSSDNIKIELSSFEVTAVQNEKVKVEKGVNPNDIKIKFNNGLLYCEDCCAYYENYCVECGMLARVLNRNASNRAVNGSREDVPNEILEIQDCFDKFGVYALRIIPAGVTFGPFTELTATECPWEIKEGKFVVDKEKSKYLNWMQYIKPAQNISEHNLLAFQFEQDLYYQSVRRIQAGEELLVYFGEEAENSLNKNVRLDFVPTMKSMKDVFACTFCCLGFSSKSYLVKHKTVCPVHQTEFSSNEELTHCSVCKIHMVPKEYHEHHMAFCSERNARKWNPSTPPVIQTAEVKVRELRRSQLFKCAQGKYRTKYKADLKKHSNKQHHEVKTHKFGISNRQYKTKEYRKLDNYVDGREDQGHSSNDNIDVHTKEEKSCSQDEMKRFKCSRCLYRTNYKRCLKIHTNTKHLNKFDYKCDKCEFRTNNKYYLENHRTTKHFKRFYYKCDKCELRANDKYRLEKHIKTKHLKEFDYKCDRCELRTNSKYHLEEHIKTKHLKEFDYECDKCEFRTNRKCELVKHIKTKHLREFDHKCDSCRFKTNSKDHLENHIKIKHLKKFDFKCDWCEFRTNYKQQLERHVKTKHVKEFDFKCDKCEFRTNYKQQLGRHMKTIHFQEFVYKCDMCEYKTNHGNYFKGHVKRKHL